MPLTDAQRAAVKYYEGDVQGDDPFWGDAKAYVTLNSLFYPGIDTERRRAVEGKRLNPAIVADPERLLQLCSNLVGACRAADLTHARTAYRVERHADYLEMRQAGTTISFTSTSSGGFLPAYGDRIGIALLEFRIPADVPCLPFGELLRDDYAKADEQEIMLPPGLRLDFQEVPIAASEMAIVDAQGNPPLVKAIVDVSPDAAPADVTVPDATTGTGAPDNAPGAPAARGSAAFGASDDAASPDISDEAASRAIGRVYEALNSGNDPADEDVALYCAWKSAFRRRVLATAFGNR